jgi:hypothetical protein
MLKARRDEVNRALEERCEVGTCLIATYWVGDGPGSARDLDDRSDGYGFKQQIPHPPGKSAGFGMTRRLAAKVIVVK